MIKMSGIYQDLWRFFKNGIWGHLFISDSLLFSKEVQTQSYDLKTIGFTVLRNFESSVCGGDTDGTQK